MGGSGSKPRVEYKTDPNLVAQMKAQSDKMAALMKDRANQQSLFLQHEKDSANKLARVKEETEAAFEKRISSMHQAHDKQMEQVQKAAERVARELAQSKAEQAAMRNAFVEMSIHHNYKIQFPMCQELAAMKQQYHNAIFIQVLGDTGVGKSTLLNRILGLNRKNEIFKTGKTETTVVTQFYDVSGKIIELVQQLKNSGSVVAGSCFDVLGKLDSNMPKVFLCDQPGIGGVKISAQTFFKKFTPGHYDFTIFCTASRLTENEVFLTKHLQTYHKDFMVIRNKCDADLMVDTEGELHNHEDFDELLGSMKEQFNKYLAENIPGKSSCLYSGTPFTAYDGEEIQVKLLNEISMAVNNNDLFDMGEKMRTQA